MARRAREASTLECADVVNVSIVLSDTFSSYEQKIWAGLAPLNRRWGYRTGKQGEHEYFESRTFDTCRMLQEYSDAVFRTISQGALPLSDIKQKVNFASSVQLDDIPADPNCAVTSQELMQEFFNDPDTLERFLQLADQTLTDRSTLPFVTMVIAARALLCIAKGNFKRAKTHMQLLNRSLQSQMDVD